MNSANNHPPTFFGFSHSEFEEAKNDKMNKLRIAVVTKSHNGLNDTVAHVFGKSKTFTVIDVENGKIENVRIIDNPAAAYDQGSGPIASKTLADLKVNMVIAAQLGPGASNLLEHHKITTKIVDPNITVAEAINKALTEISDKNA